MQVWDWDYIGASEFMVWSWRFGFESRSPDFLLQGEVTVLLPDMQAGREVEAWFTLKNRPSKPKEVVSGEIFIRYTYSVRLKSLVGDRFTYCTPSAMAPLRPISPRKRGPCWKILVAVTLRLCGRHWSSTRPPAPFRLLLCPTCSNGLRHLLCKVCTYFLHFMMTYS